ncbi:MAG: ribonuclease Y [Bacilli bacterium]|nr:ribonuclease Y [Bacilli bacterium]
MKVLVILAFIDVFLPIVIGIVCLGAGVGGGILIAKKMISDKMAKANISAEKIIEDANAKAEEKKRASIAETKQEIHQLKSEADREIKERRRSVADLENKINQREQRLDNRSSNLDKREDNLIVKERKIDEMKNQIDQQYAKAEKTVLEQEEKLIQISGMSQEKAREIIMERVENDMAMEIAGYQMEQEEKAKKDAKKKAEIYLANAIQQYSNDVVQDKTVSVVSLPNDEMKGRIIGREGRNIRAIEAATGVDIIIDDTPEAVVVSCFDPIRREIARRSLEALVQDGRIQPPKIEELVAKFKKELDNELRETGEKVVFDTGIGKIHPELVKLIGKLKYRTSYGQNVLDHSIEVAFLTGKLAAEIGENEIIARRAGLLHDIGKSMDAEMEGSHVDIGVELANRYHEKKEVIDSIASHHGDKEAETVIAHLVAAADTLSAARPGARSESFDTYIKRLTQLEEICNSFKGVDKSYALQAGREIRVLVKPEEVDDKQAYKLARDIRTKIENSLQYPGTVKVVIIREVRVQEVAK